MLSRRELFLGKAAQAEPSMADSQSGAAAIEYGLIAGLIGVVLVASLPRVGKRTRRNLNCAKRAMKGRDASRFCKRRGA
jgi:Flp pilus assembly pilin Flp